MPSTKPWLLMTPQEKKERVQSYLDCISSPVPIDEVFVTPLKPPETRLQAFFELFIYQLRRHIEKEDQRNV